MERISSGVIGFKERGPMLFTAWLIWLCVVVVAFLLLSDIRTLYALTRHGVAATAEVTHAATVSQTIRYSYTIDGIAYVGGGNIGTVKNPDNGPTVGSRITVTYDSAQRTISRSGPVLDNFFALLFLMLLIVFLAPVLIAFEYVRRRNHKVAQPGGATDPPSAGR